MTEKSFRNISGASNFNKKRGNGTKWQSYKDIVLAEKPVLRHARHNARTDAIHTHVFILTVLTII